MKAGKAAAAEKSVSDRVIRRTMCTRPKPAEVVTGVVDWDSTYPSMATAGKRKPRRTSQDGRP